MAIASDLCDDSACELLISPMPTRVPAPLHISLAPKKKRVVMVDSNKPNSVSILRRAKALLEARGIEVGEIGQKADPSRPMDDWKLDALAKEEGLILCGVSD